MAITPTEPAKTTKRFIINGAALRSIRKLMDVTVQQLANEVDASYSLLANLETGHRVTVSRSMLRKLCIALRIDDPRAIIASQDSVIDAWIADLVENAPPLSEEQRRKLGVLIGQGIEDD